MVREHILVSNLLPTACNDCLRPRVFPRWDNLCGGLYPLQPKKDGCVYFIPAVCDCCEKSGKKCSNKDEQKINGCGEFKPKIPYRSEAIRILD